MSVEHAFEHAFVHLVPLFGSWVQAETYSFLYRRC